MALDEAVAALADEATPPDVRRAARLTPRRLSAVSRAGYAVS